ncbi:unnamed protein product, partial [Rotaria sordida]
LFVDSLASVENLRGRFASTYILTIGHSLTEINNEDELSLQHEARIKESSIYLNEQHCSATS